MPEDDRDCRISDLILGRWTIAARLAHRDTGVRRTGCPTCTGEGRVPASTPSPVTDRDTEPRLSDLFTGRLTVAARRAHRTAEAAWQDCPHCSGYGVVPADLHGDPTRPENRPTSNPTAGHRARR